MCGIVAILGRHEVAPLILEALKRLEYRGYDSAGIATVHDGRLARRRAVGKLIALSDLLVQDPIRGHAGIGHTRWATHGQPSERNAHPHQAGGVAVVHNGIIENFRALRAELEAGGAVFETETDTETVVQLCNRELARGKPPVEAARATLARLNGAFALCFLFDGEDDLLVAARRGSPLAIGYGEGEIFVGSDALALAPMTSRIAYLEEGDHAVLTRTSVEIFDADGARTERTVHHVPVENFYAERGPLQALHGKGDARAAGGDRRRARPLPDAGPQAGGAARGDRLHRCRAAGARRLRHGALRLPRREVLVRAAGAAAGRDRGRLRVPLPRAADRAGRARHLRQPVRRDRRHAGGAALRARRRAGASSRSSTSRPRRSPARATSPCRSSPGPEIGVASTKAFTCQLTVLAALALVAARQRGHLDAAEEARLVGALAAVPGLVARALALEPQIAEVARDLARAQDVLFLGRGPMYPLALEGALKLKEISYIHAEGYASGELKHGPIALIDEDVPVIVLAPSDGLFDKTVSNMQEVMARDGKVLLLSDAEGVAEAGDGAHWTLAMPATDPFIAPIVYAAPAQLLAYHTAILKGTDVDQPRNLAKSVTVE